MNIITTVGDLRKALSAYAQDAKIVLTVNGKPAPGPYTDMGIHAVLTSAMDLSHVELNVVQDDAR